MEYLLKVTAVVTIFYIIYKLFLQRDTFFEANRRFLIIGLISSLLIPFLVIPIYIEYTPISFTDITVTQKLSTEPIEKPFNILDYLTLIYGLGVAFFSVRFFIQLFSLIKIIYKNKSNKKDGFVFIETPNNTSPFSFFKWIIYNPKVFSQTELEHIIEHEKTHAKQFHSVDILISQLFCVLLWFNPFIWLYNKDLKQNLEFIADKRTLKQYNCKKSYQYTLLKTSMPSHQMALSNHFYNSLIKKRIVMLHKSKSKKINQLKYLLVAPIIALFLMSFNTQEVFIEKDIKPNMNTTIILKEDIIISGTVTDINDKPIEKVMIQNGSNSGVTTNNEGKYKIKANIGDELVFTYEGMQTQKIKVTNNAPINVKLIQQIQIRGIQTSSEKTPLYIINGKEVTEDIAKAINEEKIENFTVLKDEAAIKAYGDKAKNGVVLITLKISTVEDEFPLFIVDGKEISHEEFSKLTADDINEVIIYKDETDTKKYGKKGKNGVILITSKEKAKTFEGKTMNNVTVVGYGTMSDSTKTIRIGHKLDIGKDKHPLVIVDGKESPQEEFEKLNPDKIESMTVLKDETATKKYGDKGKNGVIEITTKK
ncbi:M56 family metallopeptidase [Confluentibacter citreus]|uniref:M56 family metallopeptidase n=1 Tax=Confluentibacter citreus TaxID=2007307 RepID=UPI000C287C89|nr:M56 family metallopeptidase [Confluentibacter citreus]